MQTGTGSIRNTGVDRGVAFLASELAVIKAAGHDFVCRYYSKSEWKRMNKTEAQNITKAGLYAVAVYQDYNNSVDKFSEAAGNEHGKNAIRYAESVGQPKKTPIYFAVDFEADTPLELKAVELYFKGVVKALKDSGYIPGVYGSYTVVNFVEGAVPEVAFKWQTLAWSGGKESDYNLYQWRNGVNVVHPSDPKKIVKGVDLNYSNGNGGGWQVKV